jgi:HSP20 family protein
MISRGSNEMTEKTPAKNENKHKSSYLTSLKDMENRIEDMFHNMWDNPFHREKFPEPFSFSAMNKMPKIDVVDRDKEVVVKAEIPGFEKDDLDISIADNRLVIKAKSCQEEKEEEGDYLKQEIRKNEIYRSVLLPAEVDEENIKSKYRRGILKLTLPKQEKSQRKKIKIS